MNPDLERLVEAFYRLQECEPGEERKLLATYRRLFQDAAARLPPGRSREELQAAIRARARQKSEVMNPFPKVPTRTTDSSQFQPRVEGGKNPDPRCSAVPSAGAPMGAAGTAALPIIKAQMNTAQPAKSSVRTTNGERLPTLRTRSYNLSNAINGHPFAPPGVFLRLSFQKESEINDLGPARLITFLDVHEQGIIDPTFGTLPPGWDSPLRWWDLPADRHNRGCDFAFADGHVEHWRWAAPKIFERIGQDIGDAGDLKDFRRVQAGVRPETRF